MPSEQHCQVVDLLRSFGITDKTGRPVEEQRLAYEGVSAAYPLEAGAEIEDFSIGSLEADWVIGGGDYADTQAILYLHGGGYVIGSRNSHRELACRIASACSVRVLLPEYRLAPEHPFPAGLDDAVAAYRFLLDSHYPPSGVLIAGDSAGGGLALAVLLKILEDDLPLPCGAFILSPWVDLAMRGSSMVTNASIDPVVSRDTLKEMADYYLVGHDPLDPLVSPLEGDLHGLPRLLIQVGTAEVLLDDARRLANKATQCGVEVELQEFEGLVHVFQQLAALAPESADALAKIGEFVRSCLSRQDGPLP